MVVSEIPISQKMKNKAYLSIEKSVMKCEKITGRLLIKALVSSYKIKNRVILG